MWGVPEVQDNRDRFCFVGGAARRTVAKRPAKATIADMSDEYDEWVKGQGKQGLLQAPQAWGGDRAWDQWQVRVDKAFKEIKTSRELRAFETLARLP